MISTELWGQFEDWLDMIIAPEQYDWDSCNLALGSDAADAYVDEVRGYLEENIKNALPIASEQEEREALLLLQRSLKLVDDAEEYSWASPDKRKKLARDLNLKERIASVLAIDIPSGLREYLEDIAWLIKEKQHD